MNKRNSVSQNAVWIISCKIFQAILGLVVSMISARYLGPSNYGLINYAASVTAFAVPIMQLGFRSTLVQEVVNHPDMEGKTVGTALFFNIVSAVACMIGITTFACIANPNEPVTVIVCALYSINLLFQATEMIQYWFQAKLMSQYTSLTSLGAYAVVSVYKIYLLVTQKNIYWFAVSQAIDYFIISVVLLFLYYKLSSQKLSISFRRGLEMFSRSRFFIVSNLMVTIFSQTDRIMLKAMIDDEAVGIYSAAVACAGMTSFVFAAVIDSVRPAVYEKKKAKDKACEQNIVTCYSIIIYLSLAQSLVMSLFAPLVIYILYGSAYSASDSALRLVVWYTTFSYLGAVRDIWILAEEKQKYLWVINLSGAIANVVLNLALIPVLGVMGAALASLVTQIFTNVIVGFVVKPIRYNNRLMLQGLDPRPLIHYVKAFLTKYIRR